MAKGVPHAFSQRGPKKPIIRPSRRVIAAPAAAPKAAASAPAPKAAAPAAAPAPAPAPVSAAPLHLLGGSVNDLKSALATGDLDDHLDALLDAEEEGKARKTALDAISERMS